MSKVVKTTLESIYIGAHYVAPLLVEAAGDIFRKLGTEPRALNDIAASGNLSVGTPIVVGDVLYNKIVSDEEIAAEELKKKKASASKSRRTRYQIVSRSVDLQTSHPLTLCFASCSSLRSS